MFDHVQPAAEGRGDPRPAQKMRGHTPAGIVRAPRRRGDVRLPVVAGRRLHGGIPHPVGHEHLDEIRAVFQVPADGAVDLVRIVGQHRGDGAAGAARRSDGPARRDQPGADDPPLVDRAAQQQVDPVAVAAQPKGGRAGPQILLHAADPMRGVFRLRHADLRAEARAAGIDAEVRVKIDQAGEHGASRQREGDLVPRGRGGRAGLAVLARESGDALALNQEAPRPAGGLRQPVDHLVRLDPYHGTSPPAPAGARVTSPPRW